MLTSKLKTHKILRTVDLRYMEYQAGWEAAQSNKIVRYVSN